MHFNNFFRATNYTLIPMTTGQRLREVLLLAFVVCLTLFFLVPVIGFLLQMIYHLNVKAWSESGWGWLLLAPFSLVFVWWAGFVGMWMVHIVGTHLIEIFHLIRGPVENYFNLLRGNLLARQSEGGINHV